MSASLRMNSRAGEHMPFDSVLLEAKPFASLLNLIDVYLHHIFSNIYSISLQDEMQ